jgi:two-component system OmpR family response regulator
VPAFKPHLIVLDVMLPDMEGFVVARRLGAQRIDVPIIFLTARDATADTPADARA